MICPNAKCGEEIGTHERVCVVCGHDAGYPNCRAAAELVQVAALAVRHDAAVALAQTNGTEAVLVAFEDAASKAEAAVCRPLSRVLDLLSSDTIMYATYFRQVAAGTRIPEPNDWDQNRESVESAVFPYYYKDIVYGALTLTGIGQTAYGDVSLVLKEASICDRTSVFDEPLFPFFRRHGVVVGTAIPPGYRASWYQRGVLAAAKLGAKLTPDLGIPQFQALLLAPTTTTESDCIEVHIYGALHRRALSRVIAPSPKRSADKVLLRSVERKLSEIGVTLQLS